MNAKFLLVMLFGLIVCFTACNKDDNEPDNKIPLIKTEIHYSEGHLSSSFTYEYDQSGKLIKETDDKGAYTTYGYEKGEIIKKIYNAKANLTSTDTLLQNENGLVYADKKSTYEYNTAGYLIKYITPDFRIPETNIIFNYNISDGNTVEETIQALSITYKKTYEFMASNNTIGNENMGKPWLGKQDKNLRAEEYWYDKTDSPLWESTMYLSYETDSKNRVIRKTGNTVAKDGPEYYITYTYY